MPVKNKSVKKAAEKVPANGNTNLAQNGQNQTANHIAVQKTYKMYIGGKFPRTESGRYFQVKGTDGQLLANICRGSRKDFRNAVVVARGAFSAWSGRTAYNRGQILYRISEMLEGRKAQFIEELVQLGQTQEAAAQEVLLAIDRLVYYAGWADKYQQVFSAVNPVASSHFNFSVQEPMGVIGAFAPDQAGLLGLVSAIAPAIVGGNTVVVLASGSQPTCAISFAEVIHTSDVPGGVVNILTGFRDELLTHFSSHKDVNAMIYFGDNKEAIAEIKKTAADNLKRVIIYERADLAAESAQGPYFILDTQETKTTWHPIGN